MKYYDIKPILKKNCHYNLMFGERSNGKTYQVLLYALERFVKYGEQLAVVRRWREDFKGKRGPQYFENLVCNEKGQNKVKELTSGEWDRVVYTSSQWFLARWDSDTQRNVLNEKPIAYAFALTETEHDKGNSYNEVSTILVDEFISLTGVYLPDEFFLAMNCFSTIIRGRDTVKIFLCANANPFGKYNPYFREMGLKHVSQMQKGDIDIYEFGESGLRVAVEYTDSPNKRGKPSDVYFSFDNPKLRVITGGDWAIDIYPHLTKDFDKKDICFSYFIKFEDRIMQADIVINSTDRFTFIHEKTTPIKNENMDIIYSLTPVENYNNYVSLLNPVNNITKKIATFFKANKVFYQSNEIGEIIAQYLTQCNKLNTVR